MEETAVSGARKLALALLALAAVTAGGFMAWRESRPGPRFVLVGMDAITWDILSPLLQQGRLPHFQALIDRGSSGHLKTLRSTYISASIWTTILTGKLPKKHGISGWFSTRGFAMNSTHRKTKFLPQILGEEGLRTAAVGFWATWPAEEINGWIVSDLASYGRFKDSSTQANRTVKDYSYLEAIDRVTWPPELVREIAPAMLAPAAVPRSVYQRVLPMSDAEWESFRQIESVGRDDDLGLLKFAVVTDYNFHRAGLEIVRRHRPDAYLVYFQGPDIVEHFFWKYMEPDFFAADLQDDTGAYREVIRDYYVFMDGLLGEILAAADPEALVVVCSDHGMNRVDFLGQDNTHSGEHRLSKPPGALILAGPGVRPGVKVEDGVVVDIVPTVLYLLGLPVGKDMTGKVIEGAVTDQFRAAHPLRLIESYDRGMKEREEEVSPLDERVKDRLRSLGYIQ